MESLGIKKESWLKGLLVIGMLFGASSANALRLEPLAAVDWFRIMISSHNSTIQKAKTACDRFKLTNYELIDVSRAIETNLNGLVSAMSFAKRNHFELGQEIRNQATDKTTTMEGELLNAKHSGNGSATNHCEAVERYRITLWSLYNSAN